MRSDFPMADSAITLAPGEVEIIPGDPATGMLLLCDHASNAIPPELASLGLPLGQLERHIAYDIGAAETVRAMARATGAPAVLTSFSRLLIDPNRGLDDPTLVMRLSDGAIVPGNARIDEAGTAARIARYYAPYDGRRDGNRCRPPAGDRLGAFFHTVLESGGASLACRRAMGSGRGPGAAADRRLPG